jgi:hypothetical protein
MGSEAVVILNIQHATSSMTGGDAASVTLTRARLCSIPSKPTSIHDAHDRTALEKWRAG